MPLSGAIEDGLLRTDPNVGVVSCVLDAATFERADGFVVGSDGPLGMAQLRHGTLKAQVPPGSGHAAFVFPSVARGTLEWRGVVAAGEGECVRVDLAGESTAGVFGTVEGEPLEGATVNGCGGVSAIRNEEFFISAVPGEPCRLSVSAFVSGRVATGPAVTVTPSGSVDREVHLEYPRASDLHSYSREEVEGMRSRLEDLLEGCGDAATCAALIDHLRRELADAERARAEDLGADAPGHQ